MESIGAYVTSMREIDVLELCRSLREGGVSFWVVGGWGVDALLGRQTRHHHDVDLLIEVGSLKRFLQRLDVLGFEFAYSWEESRWLGADEWEGEVAQPTAFVLGHADGREVDVHVLRWRGDGLATALWDTREDFQCIDENVALSGEGYIGGERVPCFSADMQRRAHTGYELPPQQLDDLRLLSDLTDT
jgi:lincosamide nucleotidyltransferase A/C/D/E